LEHFKKYNNIGRDLDGLSVENPQLYRWWYRDVKNDEIPMYGSKSKKDGVQVSIEDIEEETYELPEVLDYEVKNAITQALLLLTPREERIVRERFFHGKTLEEVGQQFSITRESIRKYEARAIRKLRHPLRLNILKEVA
tara:strand:- start:344 stop:760 length:417 start_codon:yes stop_codon:yes gene_type:complete